MKKKKKKSKPSRAPAIQFITIPVSLWIISAILYSSLPQETRRPIYEAVPRLDRILRRTSFQIFSGWDELGIGGTDCTTFVPAVKSGIYSIGGQPSDPFKLRHLNNRGYAVGYSESFKNPLWATYRIFDVPKLESPPRPSFQRDPRSSAGVKPDDFTRSGYDRGHVAPNFAIATRYGPEAQKETFLMTNIMPQDPLINRYLWQKLEHRIAKEYGRYFEEIWVTTGPIFTRPVKRLPTGIAIPSAYYMIVADIHNEQLRTP
ncbi:MAG: DNA/RNA non-specific endonuclease, partial [Kiritimatiellaceae bacterium]|nr:DNA/RNA non-specific endonuclease [Kiritimatiellaceae bacterium]